MDNLSLISENFSGPKNHQIFSSGLEDLDKQLGRSDTKCPYCSYTCTRKDNLKVHIRRHTGEKPYKCQMCPKSYVSKSELNCHVRQHDKPVGLKYMCNVCAFLGLDEEHLAAHSCTRQWCKSRIYNLDMKILLFVLHVSMLQPGWVTTKVSCQFLDHEHLHPATETTVAHPQFTEKAIASKVLYIMHHNSLGVFCKSHWSLLSLPIDLKIHIRQDLCYIIP